MGTKTTNNGDGDDRSNVRENVTADELAAIAKEAKKAEDAGGTAQIQIQRIARETIEVPILGVTPLIVHKWSEKAKREMQEAQKGTRVKKQKEARDPEADFNGARYRLPDGRDGFPAMGLKSAIVEAARNFEGVTMKQLKQVIFISGEFSAEGDELVPIISEAPVMRTDTVRIGTGTADLRYRPMYHPWSMLLRVTYLPHVLSRESLFALIDAAGDSGIGEWRPSAPKGNGGSMGRFCVPDVVVEG